MRNVNKIGILAIAITLAVVVWAAANSGSAQEKTTFRDDCNLNAASISGIYAHSASGVVHPGNPAGMPAGPISSVATSTLRPDGTFTLNAKTVYNGLPAIDETVEGTFTVDGCGVTFFNADELPVVFTYSNSSKMMIHGISLIPGTNVIYLITRK